MKKIKLSKTQINKLRGWKKAIMTAKAILGRAERPFMRYHTQGYEFLDLLKEKGVDVARIGQGFYEDLIPDYIKDMDEATTAITEILKENSSHETD